MLEKEPELPVDLRASTFHPLSLEMIADLGCGIISLMLPQGKGGVALEELPQLVDALPADCQLALLPELCFGSDSDIDDTVVDLMTAACGRRPGLMLATTLCLPMLEGCAIAAVLVGSQGLVARQFQLHPTASFPKLLPGRELRLLDLPWGRVALLIADLETDFTLMTPWKERTFDGYINQPLLTRQSTVEPITSARIHPAAALRFLQCGRIGVRVHRAAQ